MKERAGEVVVREGWACGKVPLVHLGATGVPINAHVHHGVGGYLMGSEFSSAPGQEIRRQE